jgi:anaerobic ribonucleoside-triphosphate reductase activating protein
LKIVERDIVSADSVLRNLVQAKARFELEGVTFLGGEPFLQAQGLAVVAAGARESGLSVMVFTGFTLDELRELAMPSTEELLRQTDVLVDGPYDAMLPDAERNWVGSANQRFHYLSDRYDQAIESGPTGADRSIECRIEADGRVVVNGWPFVLR